MRANIAPPWRVALPWIELALLTALVTVDLWLAPERSELQLLTRAAAGVVVLGSLMRRGRVRPRPGPVGRAWREAALATLGLAAAMILFVAAASGPFDEPSLEILGWPASALGLWILLRLILAGLQQIVLQSFLWPVAREALGHDGAAILLVATVFGLFHLPSVVLAVASGVLAMVWIAVYRRSRRLLPLIVCHALLAMLASTFPLRLSHGLAAGTRGVDQAAENRFLAREESRALLAAVTTRRYFDHRGGTDRGYVQGLYRDILGRLGAPAEVDVWVGRLERTSRLAVAKQMLLADELDPATLADRYIDDEPLPPGVVVDPSDISNRAEGWFEPDGAWLWASDSSPAVRFRLDPAPGRDYVLSLSCGAAAPQTVGLELNGAPLGRVGVTNLSPSDWRFVVAGGALDPEGENLVRFRVTGERVTPPGDSRDLGFGLRQLKVAPLRFPSASVTFLDDDYFLEGFSIAEAAMRWTREPVARLAYPLHRVDPEAVYVLELTSEALGRQRVEIRLNGQPLTDWVFEGFRPQTREVRFEGGRLRGGQNEIELRLPDARSPEDDPRRLGLALISTRIYPLGE